MAEFLLSKLLPLAEDPFPPTHRAGSEFEGFFVRLESHSGRSQTSSQYAGPSSTRKSFKSKLLSKPSPSRIPRLTPKSRNGDSSASPQQLRQRRRRSSSDASSTSSSSSSAGYEPASPTPASRKTSRDGIAPRFTASDKPISPKTMLPDMEPVFASPESYLPRPIPPSASKARQISSTLPTSAPGDLILVVCELQSAPIDQRICIYLRWIVHGEESVLHDALRSSTPSNGGNERLPKNARRKTGESFEIVHYIPAWQLKVGPRAGSGSVQPFRIDLPNVDGEGLGFFEVTPEGNMFVDLTLPNLARGNEVGTRVRMRSTKFSPWRTPSPRLPMGSRGPEGFIQHLGAVLPLHWYVHSSGGPAMFSLEHVSPSNGSVELDNAVAAGRGLLHIEKNWGQAFPSGWMWAHGASPLPDPSFPSDQPFVRLSLAGGSILGLTAFLVGIHIKNDTHDLNWTFTPPFAVGPQTSFPTGTGRVHYGPGLRMHRNFTTKQFTLDVWTPTRWATIHIFGDEDTFATQIPGPRKGGWTPGYCHHSYRCKAAIVLRQRKVAKAVTLPMAAALNPMRSIGACKHFFVDGKRQEEGWKRLGWEIVAEVQLDDRVALEFGGDFAQ